MDLNICIPIPIKNTQLDKNLASIKRVMDENPEFIELRFDFIDKIEELSSEFVYKLRKSIKTDISTIFTFRHFSEGGNYQISEDKHLSIIKSFIEAQPDYIDIELRSDIKLLNQVINNAVKNKVKILSSYHNFDKTPPYIDALGLIESLQNKLTNEISHNINNLQPIIYKFIFMAQIFEDNLVPLKICKYFKEKNQNIISFCMGELGIFSRIMCPLAGSFLTYASFEEKTAPGQINITTMKEIYNLILNNL